MRNRWVAFYIWSAVAAAATQALTPIPALAVDLSQDQLNELAIFTRCYGHITQKHVQPSHPLYVQVSRGTMTGADACINVLVSADFAGPGAANEGKLVLDTPEARQVLRTMNDFHRSWFPNDNLAGSILLGDFTFQNERLLFDEAEPALHLTRALFTDRVKYSEILTSPYTMEALRTGGPVANTILNHGIKPGQGGGSSLQLIATDEVQKGILLGARRITPQLSPTKWNTVVNAYEEVNVNTLGLIYQKTGLMIHQPLDPAGGGILSSSAYHLLNQGMTTKVPSDGGLRVTRRWAATAIKDLLCREIPVIQSNDAKNYVNPFPGALTPPFRGTQTCMECHATIDNFAWTARNHSLIPVGDKTSPDFSAHLRREPVSQLIYPGVPDSDPRFFQRPPDGTFVFRGYDSTLHQTKVRGIAQLASTIAQTDDFYACATARYFEFFTGIKVSLQDIGDPNLAPLLPQDAYYRSEVIRIANEFRVQGAESLRFMIKRILESDIYKRTSMREP